MLDKGNKSYFNDVKVCGTNIMLLLLEPNQGRERICSPISGAQLAAQLPAAIGNMYLPGIMFQALNGRTACYAGKAREPAKAVHGGMNSGRGMKGYGGRIW